MQLIGNGPDQIIPVGQLGRMAFQNPESVVLQPVATANPLQPGDMVFQLTSNTSLAIKVCGSDGIVRTVSLTLV
jgi:hypothetical protein